MVLEEEEVVNYCNKYVTSLFCTPWITMLQTKVKWPVFVTACILCELLAHAAHEIGLLVLFVFIAK